MALTVLESAQRFVRLGQQTMHVDASFQIQGFVEVLDGFCMSSESLQDCSKTDVRGGIVWTVRDRLAQLLCDLLVVPLVETHGSSLPDQPQLPLAFLARSGLGLQLLELENLLPPLFGPSQSKQR
jgi:hypothetical protein